MPTPGKTIEIYKQIEQQNPNGFKYHESPVDRAYQNWLQSVTNPKTNKPFQPITDEIYTLYRIQDIDRLLALKAEIANTDLLPRTSWVNLT